MAKKTFSLPYREEPYQVTATRKFYHPQTKTVSVNPTTPNPSLSFNLVRKTGEWIYTEGSKVLPHGRIVVEDINIEPEDSYISQPGVDGLSEFSEERERIDGEWTGETRNYTETITQPVHEIYTRGTAVVTYKNDVKRTEVIPFTTEEYNSNVYYVGTRIVTQQGVDGIRSFIASQKYINGIPTGIFTGSETSLVTTQPITRRIAVGTRPREVRLAVTLSYLLTTVASKLEFNHSETLTGKEVIKVEVGEMVATGSWMIEYATGYGQHLNFAPLTAKDTFGKHFSTLMAGTTVYITYLP